MPESQHMADTISSDSHAVDPWHRGDGSRRAERLAEITTASVSHVRLDTRCPEISPHDVNCAIAPECHFGPAFAHPELDSRLGVHDYRPRPGRAIVLRANILGVLVPGVDHVQHALAIHDHVG